MRTVLGTYFNDISKSILLLIMETVESIKSTVREKYGEIARQSSEKPGCGCGCSSTSEFSMIGDEYNEVDGYVPDADLGLGCGLPTEHAGIKPGQTVLDLGSGAGLDVFVARSIVGDSGHVIGVDMTPEMIDKAKANTAKMGYTNVEFLYGDIETLPLDDHSVDVVISNCVLNLVPDKEKAFAEIYRVLKPGGHFCVSDIVLSGELPENIQKAAELYVGCVSGAMEKELYMDVIHKAGFTDLTTAKENEVPVPKAELEKYLSTEDIAAYHASGTQVLSVTVKAVRP